MTKQYAFKYFTQKPRQKTNKTNETNKINNMYTEQYYGKVCHFIEVKLQTITQSTRIHATDMQCLQSVAGSAK